MLTNTSDAPEVKKKKKKKGYKRYAFQNVKYGKIQDEDGRVTGLLKDEIQEKNFLKK